MAISRTFDLLEYSLNHHPRADAFCVKRHGQWEYFSTQQLYDSANHFSLGMLALGFRPKDHIATLSNNRPEWNMIDLGLAQCGLVHVPLYPNISTSDCHHILEEADIKAIFIANTSVFLQVKLAIHQLGSQIQVFCIDPIEGIANWTEIMDLGKRYRNHYQKELQKIKSRILPQALASIIYTSGTTGTPKGVMLSHHNIISNLLATIAVFKLNHQHRVLSFLPLNHMYERLANYIYQYKGVGIYYAENMQTIGENLREIRAHGFATVPRMIEKLVAKIVAKGRSLPWLPRQIFFWALKLGYRFEHNREKGAWYQLQLKLARRWVFRKWLNALGGNIQFISCGGAALQSHLSRLFWAMGIPLQEGYGLTETAPIIASNRTHWPDTHFGTVGLAMENVEIKIAPDGEILTRGPNLMLGYYKNPALTQQAIDSDGWFHTGDMGRMVKGRFLQITDRKKEIFKTSGGTYIAPQAIETKLKASPFIDQLMIIGENRRFPAALIAPDFEFLSAWCKRKGIPAISPQELVRHPLIINRIKQEIDKFNRDLGQAMKIKVIKLLPHTWSTETGELSPTLKLRRKVILKKYTTLIQEIYL